MTQKLEIVEDRAMPFRSPSPASGRSNAGTKLSPIHSAEAILDRIIQNAYRIEPKGENTRKLKAASTEPDARKPVKEAPPHKT